MYFFLASKKAERLGTLSTRLICLSVASGWSITITPLSAMGQLWSSSPISWTFLISGWKQQHLHSLDQRWWQNWKSPGVSPNLCFLSSSNVFVSTQFPIVNLFMLKIPRVVSFSLYECSLIWFPIFSVNNTNIYSLAKNKNLGVTLDPLFFSSHLAFDPGESQPGYSSKMYAELHSLTPQYKIHTPYFSLEGLETLTLTHLNELRPSAISLLQL